VANSSCAVSAKLLILNDYFNTFQKSDKLELINLLTKKENTWTLLVVSNDPIIMSACDRVILLRHGTIAASSTYQELLNNKLANDLIL
jgi:ABC-type branched-subunit amino acid transport system ATPase component